MSKVTLHGKLFLGPYEGYHGEAAYDPEDETFHGRVVDTKDVITFEGRTPTDIKTAFADSVDDYLEFCRERGEAPEKPFSGNFMIRLTPALHHTLTILAAQSGKSLNKYAADVLATAAHGSQAAPIAFSAASPTHVNT